MTEKQAGEERVYLAHTSAAQFTTEGSQGRNLEARAEAEAMVVLLTGLLIMVCSACLLREPRTTCLGVAPPLSITKSENAYSWTLWSNCFSRGSLLADDASLCQGDIKLARTVYDVCRLIRNGELSYGVDSCKEYLR